MRQYQIDTSDGNRYPMGITVLEHGIHVSVAVVGDSCRLVLFAAGEMEPLAVIPFPAEARQGDVWNMTLRGSDFRNLEYGFEVDGIWLPDPCGRMFSGRDSWGAAEQVYNRLRSPVLCDAFDWEGDKPPGLKYEESIVYRLHTRGFTKHHTSRAADKGTFRAVAEKIPYLKELGVTTIEMMPVAEFQEVMVPVYKTGSPYGQEAPTGKLIYWGYTGACQFAPKASYSSGKKKDPVTEFKHLVRSLHKEGMEVIIELYFSGEESPSFVLDVVRFWVQEYHVDGVHLVGCAPADMLASDPYLAGTKLWAPGWEGQKKGRIKHLGEYNDGFLADMRRVLKGDEDQINPLIFRSRRNPPDCAVINYIANTNGFTMMDMVSYEMKHNQANGENNRDGNDHNYSWNCGAEGPVRKRKVQQLRRKQIRNALLLVFLSQGTPLLLSGDEFGNSQSGNNNAYCQDNETSWLNWKQLNTNRDMYDFTKHVIAFRRKHPVFSGAAEPKLMDYLACGYPDVSYHGVKTWFPEAEAYRRQLGILYCGAYGQKKDGGTDDYFYVVYNMHWEPHEFALPNLPRGKTWHTAFDTDNHGVNGFYPEGEEPELEDQKRCLVPSRTILVLTGY